MGLIHVHQGGTLRAYCGLQLVSELAVVSWEDAARSSCLICSAHFAR